MLGLATFLPAARIRYGAHSFPHLGCSGQRWACRTPCVCCKRSRGNRNSYLLELGFGRRGWQLAPTRSGGNYIAEQCILVCTTMLLSIGQYLILFASIAAEGSTWVAGWCQVPTRLAIEGKCLPWPPTLLVDSMNSQENGY